MSAIDITELSKRFGDTVVLTDLDLHVPSGAVTAILGSSGSGKSTLLRCIAGLLRPDSGMIGLADRTVCGPGIWIPAEDRRVGLVPQEGSLFPHLTVAGNVGFGLARRDRATRVAQLLELVGLPGTSSMRPHELSGGMQQRVAVARALAPEPDVILLDEPFSALDAGLRDDLRTDVFSAIRATGATAVLVTHDQQEAFAVADRVAVMMHGRVVQDAPPSQVYLEPATLAVAQFVGETVVLPATVTATGHAHTPLGDLPVIGDATPGTTGNVVFRPEDFVLDASARLTDAEVESIRYHGHDTVLTATAGGVRLRIRTLGRPPVGIGESVPVGARRPGTFFAAE
jgi:iron(III) transport system ATP-binding protein